MRILWVKVIGLAAIGLCEFTDVVLAQAVSESPRFTKQAFDANGQPLTGPLSANSVVNFVLSYNYGNAPAGAVTIDDTLSSSLAYVNPSISAAGWNYPLVPYSVG